MPVGACFLDREFRYVFINKWLAKLNGKSIEQHRGRTIWNMVPQVADKIERELRRALKSGKEVKGSVEAPTAANPSENRFFRHSYYPFVTKGEEAVGVWCEVQDLTESKRAKRNLPSAKLRYHELIGIEICNVGGTITFCSPGAERLKGFGPGKLVGHSIWDCSVDEKAALKVQDGLKLIVEKQDSALTPWSGPIKQRKGTVINVQVDSNYLWTLEGKLDGFVSVITECRVTNQGIQGMEATA